MADDLLQMQRAAARRVQQMQEHSRRVFEAHQGYAPTPLAEPAWSEELHSPGLYARPEKPASHPEPAPASPPEHLPTPCPTSGPLAQPAVTLSLPRLEAEQWLLLGLALLLFRTGCRTELLLALLYLAL